MVPVSITSPMSMFRLFESIDAGAVNSCYGERAIVGSTSRQDDHKRKADIGK